MIGYLRDALIREGDPVEVIASEGRCFSLVTMAETSRSKLRQSADVAYGVLRKAENSVLVMRGA
ncbi:MAG: hypothetical protein ACLFQR_03525 [Desulfovibrionales bacterium]